MQVTSLEISICIFFMSCPRIYKSLEIYMNLNLRLSLYSMQIVLIQTWSFDSEAFPSI